jgi:hypothetical protein
MVQVWSESWREPQAFVQTLQDLLAARGGYVRSGGPFDRWDLDLRAGPLGGVKIRTAVEEHGDGKQLMRARIWPRASTGSLMVVTLLAAISAYAAFHGRPEFAVASGVVLLLVVGLGIEGTGTAMSVALSELERMNRAVGGSAPERRRRRRADAVAPPRMAVVEVDEARLPARATADGLFQPQPTLTLSEMAAGVDSQKDR